MNLPNNKELIQTHWINQTQEVSSDNYVYPENLRSK